MQTDKRTPLRKIRERLGVTQREIGEAIGVTPAHAANMERGLHPVMPPQALKLVGRDT